LLRVLGLGKLKYVLVISLLGDGKMTKFYIRWQMDTTKIPVNPEERVKLWLSMLEMVKTDLNAGLFKDWGICSDASCGYCFSELSEVDLYTALLKWMPNIQFDVKPVLNVDQTIASIKKAVAAMKK
jgi:hypothetical protein